jgi:hypothetical protein
VPKDPKWGEGPPLGPKEKKVLKEGLQVLAEEPWRQQYLDLMLRYHNVLSKDKFDLVCADVIELSIVIRTSDRFIKGSSEYCLRTKKCCTSTWTSCSSRERSRSAAHRTTWRCSVWRRSNFPMRHLEIRYHYA